MQHQLVIITLAPQAAMAIVTAIALATAGCAGIPQSRTTTQEQLGAAETTLQSFAGDPQMHWLRENLPRARAVLISPSLTRGALGVGAATGDALAFAKDEKSGKWLGPAFYDIRQASIGFQAGVDVSEVLVLIMSQQGVETLLEQQPLRLGAEASVAAGPASGGATSGGRNDMVTLTRSKGVYAGMSLEGAVLRPDHDANRAFYGTRASAADILVDGTVENAAAGPVQRFLLQVAQSAGHQGKRDALR